MALQKNGRDTTRLRYVSGTDTLYCDVYEPKRKHLIEAKGSTGQEDIRIAIGQLLDYSRLTKAAELGNSRLGMLLPERPKRELERLLDSLDIALIWKHGKNLKDNRGGKFV